MFTTIILKYVISSHGLMITELRLLGGFVILKMEAVRGQILKDLGAGLIEWLANWYKDYALF